MSKCLRCLRFEKCQNKQINGCFNYFPEVYKPYIPMFTGRPKRDTIISQDDIINLKIDLNINKELVK